MIPEHIIFKACQDLWRTGDIRHSELALKWGKRVSFDFDKEWTFNSYCFEFCGKYNLKIGSLKFLLNNSWKLPFHKCPKWPVEISVYKDDK